MNVLTLPHRVKLAFSTQNVNFVKFGGFGRARGLREQLTMAKIAEIGNPAEVRQSTNGQQKITANDYPRLNNQWLETWKVVLRFRLVATKDSTAFP